MEFVFPFYYTYFLLEIYTVLKEDNIKNVSVLLVGVSKPLNRRDVTFKML